MLRSCSFFIVFFTISLASASRVLRNSLPPLPPDVSSKLRSDPNATIGASRDFGNLTQAIPAAVLYPCSANDIAALIQASYSSSTPFKIAARGRSHSTHGQALALDGVVVEMASLSVGSRINVSTNPEPFLYADVGGEQLWIDVLQRTLEYGLSPVSWTDYLYLTVGGTLSNAGISGQAYRHGPQTRNVYELDVVTGKGEIVTCSPQVNSDLFYAVLGGLGQFGIITRARIALGQAHDMARWIRLIYTDGATVTRDQEYLISLKGEDGSAGAFDYIEGSLVQDTDVNKTSFFSRRDKIKISALAAETKLLYCLEVTKYYNSNESSNIDQEVEDLLKQLSFLPGHVYSKDVSYLDFLNRVHQEEEQLRALGLWDVRHPWLNLFLPKSRILDFDAGVFQGILKNGGTDGPMLFYPMNRDKWDLRTSTVIPDEDVFYTVALLRPATTDAQVRFLEDQNNQILSFCDKAGLQCKQYLSYLQNNDQWKKHFGPKWDVFLQRKIAFDPKEILSPGQNIFAS